MDELCKHLLSSDKFKQLFLHYYFIVLLADTNDLLAFHNLLTSLYRSVVLRDRYHDKSPYMPEEIENDISNVKKLAIS